MANQFTAATPAWEASTVVGKEGGTTALDVNGAEKVGAQVTPGGNIQSRIINIDSCGVCDPTHQDDVLATQWGLYSTGFLQFTLDTTAPTNRISTQIAPLNIFVTGQGFVPSTLLAGAVASGNEQFPYALGQGQTNILRSGFPATGESFVATGITVHIGSPVVFNSAGPVSVPSLNLGNGVYRPTLVESIRDNLALQITFDQGTRNKILQLGPLSWMPDYVSGGTEIGYTSMVHSFAMPFVISRPSNTPQEAPQVQLLPLGVPVLLAQDQSSTLAADLLAAVVGSSPTPGTTLSFYVPIKVTILGVRFCYNQVCATDSAELTSLRAEMAAIRAQLAASAPAARVR